ncbi:hypothetical protein MLD38_028680 [Melastoma candidum]|uniref:Uncharacterized protein n=1 Tax=Melastoma candidum TaxID=119954 RepID=A0ACB9N1P1_9MYRT|nr:hypothetical protein MLD38_028680 [Melastoma candidum]
MEKKPAILMVMYIKRRVRWEHTSFHFLRKTLQVLDVPAQFRSGLEALTHPFLEIPSFFLRLHLATNELGCRLQFLHTTPCEKERKGRCAFQEKEEMSPSP